MRLGRKKVWDSSSAVPLVHLVDEVLSLCTLSAVGVSVCVQFPSVKLADQPCGKLCREREQGLVPKSRCLEQLSRQGAAPGLPTRL